MGTLFVVATPIGNLSDFSLRGIETLKTCDYILAEDTRQTIKLLNHFEIKNKMVSYHKFNEEKKSASVIEDLKSGKNIALVSDAGTPCISDPGYILVKHARENNIKVASVPGCSALIAALSAGGLDTSTFTFYGFVPTENKPRKELFESIKHSNIKTKVVYESPKRIIKLLKELKDEMPGCVICVASEITKVHESYEYGKIEDVYEKMKDNPDSLKGEYVILIQNEKEDEKESAISIEAMLVDIIIKEKCSIKDAIKILNEKQKDISKKDIYNASLNLKEILK
ncbi:MAG TPA: 16S rRNA (cytidine(1402)-2'-O)-methyltransferase [Candidatus Aphodocola excrementigallinarum]|uniref:Ribosomal RNA small subunit methyltransferase I n=1 Tax=Candidatus Aphodocola excrementigallinarum TaxID=2840670 RepID=A0A9D1IN17_9FIRM|nr:16S rRNA (cytidine(1402)-2'-O)-methyltransferase [Candidatus Aphodocola excrementigallinarum]